jgi:hypothetical protein
MKFSNSGILAHPDFNLYVYYDLYAYFYKDRDDYYR